MFTTTMPRPHRLEELQEDALLPHPVKFARHDPADTGLDLRKAAKAMESGISGLLDSLRLKFSAVARGILEKLAVGKAKS